MISNPEKKSRLVARVPNGIRKTIQDAARLQGVPVNQFVVQSTYRCAQEVLERDAVIRLSRTQAKHVFEMLDAPPKPNAALIAAKVAHRKLVRA